VSAERDRPNVFGFAWVECVGGPLDGCTPLMRAQDDRLFYAAATPSTPKRTLTVACLAAVPEADRKHLTGYYFRKGDSARWYPLDLPATTPAE
jgi:hypothetical protein